MMIDDTKKKARRMAQHPVICFTNEDLKGMNPHPDDLVVVSVVVANFLAPYNVLLGRPFLNALGAVVSTSQLSLKFPVSNTRVGVIRSDQKEARQCYHDSLETRSPKPAKDGGKTDAPGSSQTTDVDSQHPRHHVHMVELDSRIEFSDRRPQPKEELHPVSLVPRPKQVVRIGSTLLNELNERLISLLLQNANLFAWTLANMPGIDPLVICHKLALDPEARLVAQRKKRLGEERQRAVAEETAKLLKVGCIREVPYTTWLANVVMVKKSPGKWRMCVDFTNLNKEYPKESYPLPNIDRLVDATSRYRYLSFMDAYSGYN
ncbi:uncharacterized protein LOC127804575 [Diospyros lotus]|uniref:uncharacterized protein LOC127804575 n=1 Tax=Diospyros lotus TaxID=55363 RepID=UPI0022550F52|nr:uncharacterized protein LOC127804575 [Diospyros lotus]